MAGKSRHGQHDEDLVSFSGRVTAELLALVKVVCLKRGCTGMDLLRKGVETEAIRDNVIVNGEIAPEYKAAYDLQLEVIKNKRQEHLAKTKGGKA